VTLEAKIEAGIAGEVERASSDAPGGTGTTSR
jgi:hypothetical protein